MLPLVSVIILSWNRAEDLKDSLTKIKSGSYTSLEIIVVDNNSTDDTREILKRDFSEVKLIALDTNRGIASYNSGFRAATGKYLAILDDDSYPAFDAIEKSVVNLEADEKCLGIAWQIINPNTKQNENADWPERSLTFIGCGAIIRREPVLKVGEYDDDFFLYCNETDLTIRLLVQNPHYYIKFNPTIIGYHKTAAINRSGRRRAYYQLRNNLWILWKHFSLITAVKLSLRRIFEEFIFLFTWHKSPMGLITGLGSAIKGLVKQLKKRKVVPPALEKQYLGSSQLIFGEPIILFLRNNYRLWKNKK